MDVESVRSEHEATTHKIAERAPKSVAAWVVRRGAVEVRRAVDGQVAWDARVLLRSIDGRRYATPEGQDIREAREAAIAATERLAMLLADRRWDLHEADARSRRGES